MSASTIRRTSGDAAHTPSARDFAYGAALVGALHLALLAAWLGHVATRSKSVALTPPLIEAQLIAPAATPAESQTPPIPVPRPIPVRSVTPAHRAAAHAPPARVQTTAQTAVQTTTPATAVPQPVVAATDHPSATAPSAAATPPDNGNAMPAAAATPPTAPQPATLPAGAPVAVAHLECEIARPDYPTLSRRNGESGSVLVQLVIDAQGRIENALLHSGSGHPRLDQAALQAARDSRCRPYIQHGQAIPASAYVPFRFTLDD